MDEMTRFRVGVAGTGFIGPAHVEALRRLGIEVIGIASSSAERAAAVAKRLGISRAYDSYDAMASDPDIQVVHITSPNNLHYPQTRQALLAGKHVICEKPFALNTAQSSELVLLAREKRLVTAVNFNLRFYPMVHHARAMVQSGELGEIYIIQGSYLQDWLLYDTDWNWRLEPEIGGQLRAMGDIGSHWLDMMTFVSGRHVQSVLADFHTFLPVRKKPVRATETFGASSAGEADTVDQEIHTEDYAAILLRYEGNTRGALVVSQLSAGRKNRLSFEIDGARGAVAWDSERPNELWIGHRDRPNELLLKDPALLAPEARQYVSYPGGHNEGFPDTFKQLYTAFYRYLAAGDYDAPRDFPTFDDGHYGILLGETIGRSAQEGRWIDIGGEP